MSLRIWSRVTSGLCWVERTTVSTRTGWWFSSYSPGTWVLPSGRREFTVPSVRTWVRRRAILWAREMARGMSSGVSSQA